MIATFQKTGVSAGTVKWSYELRIPTMIPEAPSSITIGKRTRARPTVSCGSAAWNGRRRRGAASISSAVSAPSPRSISQKSDDATRQARRRSPFSSSSRKTGTKAEESAASATSARTRFGSWNATVNALIGPRAPK